MNWKIKVTVGEVSMESEIPLSERKYIDLGDDGSAGKTMKILESLVEKALEASIRFENEKPKSVTTTKKS